MYTASASAGRIATYLAPSKSFPFVVAPGVPIQVGISEGRDLSRQYNTAFQEVSVADNPVETIAVINRIVRELWREKVGQACSNSHGFTLYSVKPWLLLHACPTFSRHSSLTILLMTAMVSTGLSATETS